MESNKKNLIMGATSFARVLRYQMESSGSAVEGYCMTKDFKQRKGLEVFDERPIFAFEDLDQLFGENRFQVYLAIGYSGMNKGREMLFGACQERGNEIGSFIHPSVHVDTVQLGRGNIVLEGSKLGLFSTIGDGNIIWGAATAHDGKIGNFNYLTGCVLGGESTIGDRCFVGMQAVTRDKSSIGNCCLIGMGVVLNKNIPDNTVVMPPKQRIIHANPEDMDMLL